MGGTTNNNDDEDLCFEESAIFVPSCPSSDDDSVIVVLDDETMKIEIKQEDEESDDEDDFLRTERDAFQVVEIAAPTNGRDLFELSAVDAREASGRNQAFAAFLCLILASTHILACLVQQQQQNQPTTAPCSTAAGWDSSPVFKEKSNGLSTSLVTGGLVERLNYSDVFSKMDWKMNERLMVELYDVYCDEGFDLHCSGADSDDIKEVSSLANVNRPWITSMLLPGAAWAPLGGDPEPSQDLNTKDRVAIPSAAAVVDCHSEHSRCRHRAIKVENEHMKLIPIPAPHRRRRRRRRRNRIDVAVRNLTTRALSVLDTKKTTLPDELAAERQQQQKLIVPSPSTSSTITKTTLKKIRNRIQRKRRSIQGQLMLPSTSGGSDIPRAAVMMIPNRRKPTSPSTSSSSRFDKLTITETPQLLYPSKEEIPVRGFKAADVKEEGNKNDGLEIKNETATINHSSSILAVKRPSRYSSSPWPSLSSLVVFSGDAVEVISNKYQQENDLDHSHSAPNMVEATVEYNKKLVSGCHHVIKGAASDIPDEAKEVNVPSRVDVEQQRQVAPKPAVVVVKSSSNSITSSIHHKPAFLYDQPNNGKDDALVFLNKDNFHTIMAEQKYVFVNFVAWYCKHKDDCMYFPLIKWRNLANRIASSKLPVMVATIDCLHDEATMAFCRHEHGLSYFPSMRWFVNGTAGEDYTHKRKKRNVRSLMAFIKKQLDGSRDGATTEEVG